MELKSGEGLRKGVAPCGDTIAPILAFAPHPSQPWFSLVPQVPPPLTLGSPIAALVSHFGPPPYPPTPSISSVPCTLGDLLSAPLP